MDKLKGLTLVSISIVLFSACISLRWPIQEKAQFPPPSAESEQKKEKQELIFVNQSYQKGSETITLIDETGNIFHVKLTVNEDGTRTIECNYLRTDPQTGDIIIDEKPCEEGGIVPIPVTRCEKEFIEKRVCPDGQTYDWYRIKYMPKK